MLWVGNPRTIYIGTTVKAVQNQTGGRLAYPHIWVLFFFLVVFGIVSRIIDISYDIFGIYRYQYREYVRHISYQYHATYRMISMLHYAYIYTTSRLSEGMTCVFVRVEI